MTDQPIPSPFRFDPPAGDPSPFEAVVIPDALVKFIQEKIGAKGILILATKNSIPCEHKDGEHCSGHPISIASNGLRHDILPALCDAAKITIIQKNAAEQKRRGVDNDADA